MYGVLAVFSGIILYTSYVVVRRLFFHPLARFPGPKIAAATYWYEFYHDLIVGETPGRNVFNIDKLHEVYGPVVRINPDELSVSDPDWFDVLYNSGRRDKYLKNHKANGSPGSIASTVSREHHRQRRAPLTHFFSKRSVEKLDAKIQANVDLLTDGIAAQYLPGHQPFHIGVAFTALTLDVITDYCFGQSFHCLTAPDFAPGWKKAMTGLFEPVPLVKQLPWINQFMMRMPTSVLRKIAPDMLLFFEARAACHKQSIRIISEREAKEAHRVDDKGEIGLDEDIPATVFHAILDSSLPDEEKTVERLNDEAFVMIVAGGETTAKALTIALYHLLANPAWLEKAVTELDETIPNRDVLPNWSTLEKLPVLSSAIKETLRISSPVTNRLQLVEPREALQCHEWSIPPGTPLSMSTPAIHLNPTIFPNPHNFDPSRWMGDQGKISTKYYMPFSRGSRGCLGLNLAYSELHLGLAAVLRRFELELYQVVRERDVDVVRDCFVGLPSPQSQGVRVKVLRARP